jgi:tetratricopeptide (TPR) repeat protein
MRRLFALWGKTRPSTPRGVGGPQGPSPSGDDQWPDDDPALALERRQRLNRRLWFGLLLVVLSLVMFGPAVLDLFFERRATKPSRELAKENREAIAKGDRAVHDQALREADAKVKEGRLDEAKAILLKQLPLDLTDADVYLRIGEICLRQGEPRVAYHFLKAAADRWPDNPEILSRLGELLLLDHDYQAARGIAARVRKRDEYVSRALLLESQIAFGEGHLAEALQKALEAEKRSQQPLQVKWYAYIADLYMRKGDRLAAAEVIHTHLQSEMDADDLLSLAKFYLRVQDEAGARSHFEDALKRYPQNPEVLYTYGEYLFSQRDFRGAITYYTKALEILPNLPLIEYNIGRAFLAADDVTGLKGHIDRLLAAHAENMFALRLKAQYHLRLGQRTAAIETLKTIVRIAPDAVGPRIVLGGLYVQEGKLALAEECAKKALSLGDPSISPHVLLADVYFRRGMYERATTHLTSLLAIQPTYLPALLQLGDTHLNLGKYKLAEEQYAKAVAQNPSMKDLKTKLIWLKAVEGDPEQALSMAQKYWQEMPEDKNALVGYINTLVVNHRLNDAMAVVMLNTKQYPKDWRLHYLLGDLYLVKKEKKLALASYQRALTLNPDDPNLVLNLSARYVDTHLEREAERILLAFRERQPGNMLTLNQLAWLYIDTLNSPEKAKPLVDALRVDADEPTATDTIGWYYFKVNRFGEAEYYFRRALRLDPENTAIQKHLALTLERMSQK